MSRSRTPSAQSDPPRLQHRQRHERGRHQEPRHQRRREDVDPGENGRARPHPRDVHAERANAVLDRHFLTRREAGRHERRRARAPAAARESARASAGAGPCCSRATASGRRATNSASRVVSPAANRQPVPAWLQPRRNRRRGRRLRRGIVPAGRRCVTHGPMRAQAAARSSWPALGGGGVGTGGDRIGDARRRAAESSESASRNAAASGHRSSGFFAIARSMARSSPGGHVAAQLADRPRRLVDVLHEHRRRVGRRRTAARR